MPTLMYQKDKFCSCVAPGSCQVWFSRFCRQMTWIVRIHLLETVVTILATMCVTVNNKHTMDIFVTKTPHFALGGKILIYTFSD